MTTNLLKENYPTAFTEEQRQQDTERDIFIDSISALNEEHLYSEKDEELEIKDENPTLENNSSENNSPSSRCSSISEHVDISRLVELALTEERHDDSKSFLSSQFDNEDVANLDRSRNPSSELHIDAEMLFSFSQKSPLEAKEDVSEEDIFHNVRSHASLSEDEVYEGDMDCICQRKPSNMEDDEGMSIQCEKCNQWQHVKCLGFSDASHESGRAIPDVYFCPKCLRKWPDLLQGHESTLGFLLDLLPRPRGRRSNASEILDVESLEEQDNSQTSDSVLTRLEKYVKYIDSNKVDLTQAAKDYIEKIFEEFELREPSSNIVTLPRLLGTKPPKTHFLDCISMSHDEYLEAQNNASGKFIKRELKIKMASEVIVQSLLDSGDILEDKILRYIESTSGKRFEYMRRMTCVTAANETIEPNAIIGVLSGTLRSMEEIKALFPDSKPKKIISGNYLFFHPALPLVVDTRDIGNTLRFMRKSCRSNAVLKGIFVTFSGKRDRGTKRTFKNNNLETFVICVVATHVIPPNTEICLPLDYHVGNSFHRYLCGCHVDFNVPSWFSESCLMPRDSISNSFPLPIAEKLSNVLSKENNHVASDYKNEEVSDGDNPNPSGDYLIPSAAPMRPLRYIPKSYKDLDFSRKSTTSSHVSRFSSLQRPTKVLDENNAYALANVKVPMKRGPQPRFTLAPSKRLEKPRHRMSSIDLTETASGENASQGNPSPGKKRHVRKIENSLSPPRTNRTQLSREERKLQMYIETIQRIEARENKKRKNID